MTRLLAATLLLGGCLASGGTATVVSTPVPLPFTATSAPATATATATMVPTPTPGMPADFAFRFSVNWCGDLIEIDTIAGTYTVEIGGGLDRGQVSVALTPAELLVYYREFELLDPFGLPTSLPYRRGGWIWSEYSLSVQMNGRVKDLYWSGNSWSTTPTALEQRVRRFAASMEHLVRNRPELRELRSRGRSCT
ncbi:MAG: hypothetical protein U0232_14290 [Thermomicrobiales bacterium]